MVFNRLCLNLLVNNDYYFNRVISHLDADLFQDEPEDKTIFEAIKTYHGEKGLKPTPFIIDTMLNDALSKNKDLAEEWNQIKKLKVSFKDEDEIAEIDSFVEATEDKFKAKKLEVAILESVEIIQDKKQKNKNKINDLITDALNVSFMVSFGHEFVDFDDRWKNFYSNRDAFKISTGHAKLDEVTNGGYGVKTLNIVLAGTNVGKTVILSNLCLLQMLQARDSLYITLEISEEEMAKRLDAILLEIPLDELNGMINEERYKDAVARVEVDKSKWGRLKIKEFPASTINTNTIKKLLNDLKYKDGFVPQTIFIDYLGLENSNRDKQADSSYIALKQVAEETRGLATALNIPIISAHQLNRDGNDNEAISIKHIADSMAIANSADFALGLYESEELSAKGLLGAKILKTRYKNNKGETFKLKVDKRYLKICEASDDLTTSEQIKKELEGI